MIRIFQYANSTKLFAVVVALAAIACDKPSGSDGHDQTITRASAVITTGSRPVTRLTPPGPTAPRASDVGFPAGTPLPRAISRPVAVSALQQVGHFQSKVVSKPAPAATAPPPPPPPAAYVAKQQEYVRQWKELLPTIANLPPDEQEARRAALKNSIVGQ